MKKGHRLQRNGNTEERVGLHVDHANQEELSPQLAELGTTLDNAVAQARDGFSRVETRAQLQEAKKLHSGDAAAVTLAGREISKLPAQEKSSAGKIINSARQAIKESLAVAEDRIQAAEQEELLSNQTVDVTLPTARRSLGALHPIRLIVQEVERFFISLGWEIKEGPEVESEYYNFDALNFLPDHPARTLQDTFYISGDNHLLLRTHTSPVQIRSLLNSRPPLFIISPGRVFRSDTLDATHSPIFTQVEGLAVAPGLTMTHLKGTLNAFARALFSADTQVRLRPHYFPFTEPSMECDVWFTDKASGAGWIEWGGCGMIHPHVLRACGIDPELYQGFAFGMGLDRTVMLRNGISDIRDLLEGDIRFSQPCGLGW